MGITDIVSDYITAVILGYSQGIDKSKVSVSLKNLKLEIKDLELYKFAMMQHGLPIVINRGFIGSITVEADDHSLTEILHIMNMAVQVFKSFDQSLIIGLANSFKRYFNINS